MITLNSDAASTSLSKTTKAILNEYGIKLNKNLGQNYLIDRNKRDQIIQFGNLTKDDVVLEIGPGIGTLTIELAKRVKKVIAIEQDSNICQILENRLLQLSPLMLKNLYLNLKLKPNLALTMLDQMDRRFVLL